jgi:hypothetical protein
MKPILIRLLGSMFPALPKAEEGTIWGRLIIPRAAEVAPLKNLRRLIFEIFIIKSPNRLYLV